MEWKKHIEDLQKKKAAGTLKESLNNAITKMIPSERYGVLFSGGIDSTFIAFVCKQLGKSFTCYCVGLENSEDIIEAEKVAKELDLQLKKRIFSLDEAEEIIRKTVKMLGSADVMQVGVGSTISAAAELALKDNTPLLFSGLGSEEIFAGYQRHEESKDINEECWKGLVNMYERDMLRDNAISKALGVTFLVPFLDQEVIVEAMAIEGSEKIKDGLKKVPLRKIAEEMGIPKEIAERKKKAAQYGSKFDRAILRLAKRNGYRYKKDYLESLR
ncbi:hypothetical protein GOV09_06695 [Candidatus Woesearchaeota archaeon]|nr:hypothetical protein [Candidatus Woesearchaeota archaeon]